MWSLQLQSCGSDSQDLSANPLYTASDQEACACRVGLITDDLASLPPTSLQERSSQGGSHAIDALSEDAVAGGKTGEQDLTKDTPPKKPSAPKSRNLCSCACNCYRSPETRAISEASRCSISL